MSADANKGTALKVEPVFITIDPVRDGPDQLKSYLSDWHPRFIGLTGTQEQTGSGPEI
jgi:protein SCO1